MKTSSRILIAVLCCFYMFLVLTTTIRAQKPSCTFSMIEIACLEQHVKVTFTGTAPQGVIYKLRRNYEYTGINKIGTGNAIDFGKQTEPGVYDCVAKIDGSDCLREMEGEVEVWIIGGSVYQHICMVSFDTTALKNMIIWNKVESASVAHFNIYRETYQN
ncbi:MAG: hypothetical protein HQ542_05905, partial [Bacteroidia bacterium]|nr:hypothetical protein [Bacteroidia bacterium]